MLVSFWFTFAGLDFSNKNNNDIAGFLLAFLIIGSAFFFLPFPVVVWFIDLNPVSEVVANLNILPHVYYRSAGEIVFANIFSLLLFTLGIYTCMKYVFIFILIPTLMGVYAMTVFQTLIASEMTNEYSEDLPLFIFEFILMVATIEKEFIAQLTFNLIVTSQLVLTIFAWLSINCFRIIPVFIVATAIGSFACGFSVAYFLLMNTTNVRLVSAEIIQRKRNQYSGRHCGKWSKERYLNLKWKAQQPLPLYCGSNFALSKDAIINYINVLNTNITNAILLIFP